MYSNEYISIYIYFSLNCDLLLSSPPWDSINLIIRVMILIISLARPNKHNK